jgi:hypothetical protein
VVNCLRLFSPHNFFNYSSSNNLPLVALAVNFFGELLPVNLLALNFLSTESFLLVVSDFLVIHFWWISLFFCFIRGINYCELPDDLNGSVGSIADLKPKGPGFDSRISQGFFLM